MRSAILLLLIQTVCRAAVNPQLAWTARFGSYTVLEMGGYVPLLDSASGIAVDGAGNTYVIGTVVAGVPQVNPIPDSCINDRCVFVTKFGPDGKAIVYSSYVASPELPWQLSYQLAIPAAIAVDSDGNAYVTGAAWRIPRAGGGTDQAAGAEDVFVLKLDPNGVLKASMLIGGSGEDQGTSISVGSDGYLYIAGTTQSADFPTSYNAYETNVPGPSRFFSLKIDPKLLAGDLHFPSAVVYSSVFVTYSQLVSTVGISVPPPRIGADASGNAYVSVYTDCTGIYATAAAMGTNCQPNDELFSVGVVAKLDASGTKLLWVALPTGSENSSIAGLAVTADGHAYIAGNTSSTDFPVTAGAFNTAPRTSNDSNAFLAKLNPDGTTLAFATYLGDSGSTGGVSGLALDANGNAYVAGATTSARFPILNSIQSPVGNCCAGFVTVFKPDGSGLLWSTLLGVNTGVEAVTADAAGDVYAAGYRLSPSATVSIFNTTYASGQTIDVLKIVPGGQPLPIDGIANAASFASGLPMSGGLASMFVHGLDFSGLVEAPGIPLPVELAGVSILVNGIPAPILSVSSGGPPGAPGSQQINFQVPFEANVQTFTTVFNFSALSYTSVELRYEGSSSFGLPATAGPGIFTLPDGSGAVQHASDYSLSLVTPQNPAVPGEVIIVYATGLGPVKAMVASGSAATGPAPITGYCSTPPTVNVGDVLYAGLTPGIPGLYQMNVRMGSSAAAGVEEMYVTWTDCESVFSRLDPVQYVLSKSNSVALPVR